MRAGLSTIQQTLTPEAASVLNHSIAEAARRNHGQTTPLHVAATLLASPSGYLRQACIRSHPNSSHPLQCRALELCFSVALERLPSAQNLSPGLEPPISNALMAALKRAQAHQRRGCPEQQQQPLLAVKVELEQLIVSILDDPSVSRVMREASFASPAVKATIEQSLNSSGPVGTGAIGGGLGFRPGPAQANRNLYLNPRLQQGSVEPSGQQRKEEVKRVIDILLRSKKRNPVLVGESEPEAVMRELLQRIEKREISEGLLRNVQVVSLNKEIGSDRSQIQTKLIELGNSIEARINGSGVILDLGDLKWLVEQPAGFGVSSSGPLQIVSEACRTAVVEMGKLLARFGEGSSCAGGRLWLIGTATCETYLRCQVYHPSMENDWDLQAVPIAARSLPGLFPRIGGNGILSSSVGSLAPLKVFPMAGAAFPPKRPTESADPARGISCCLECMGNYEQELAKLVSKEFEKSSSDAKPEAKTTLPQWMQRAMQNSNDPSSATDQSQSKNQETTWKLRTEELQKKWNETCRQLHPSFHSAPGTQTPVTIAHPIPSLYNPNLLNRQPFQPKLHLPRNPPTLQLGHIPLQNPSDRPTSPSGSPVRTDLALGQSKIPENSLEKTHKERIKDFAGCIPSEWQDPLSNREKHANALDADSFKRIFKGLTEKVDWQPEAASAVAMAIIQCKSGIGKRRGVAAKGDTWLLFVGPDKIGKKKMASALSELVCGANPITISLGSRPDDDDDNGSDVNFRGKTVLDRITEAVRRNPFSVVVLEDVDHADLLVRGGIKRAVEKGRLTDSHGREVGLGRVIFILTADWLPDNLKGLQKEEQITAMAGRGWQLQITLGRKTTKRRAEWAADGHDDRPTKPRREVGPALSIDLNLAANVADEDGAEGSRNSSDLTVDHDHERNGPVNRWPLSLPPNELIRSVDDTIPFKPVDFGPVRTKVAGTIRAKFSSIVGDGRSLDVEDETLDRIVAGAWFGRSGLESLDEWVDRVLVPGFQQVKGRMQDCTVARLTPVKDGHVPVPEARKDGDWLPSKINVVTEGP